jgi:hypothetical protein
MSKSPVLHTSERICFTIPSSSHVVQFFVREFVRQYN